MKKLLSLRLFLMLGAMALLASCGSKIETEPYPFESISKLYEEYKEKSSSDFDEKLYKEYVEKRKASCEQLNGKAINAAIDENLGFEVVSRQGVFENCNVSGMSYEKTEFEIVFDLKVIDAELAANMYGTWKLIAVFYDDQNEIIYADHLICSDEEITSFNVGDVAKARVKFRIKSKGAPYFKDISKVIIQQYDGELLDRYQQRGA